MRLRSIATLLATSATPLASTARAQTSLLHASTLTAATPLASYSFQVTTAGTFQLYTQAPTIDPVIFLFSGTSFSESAFIMRDDDSCPNALCGASGGYHNALITRFLDVGTYTIAGAQCCTVSRQLWEGSVDFRSPDAPIDLVVAAQAGIAVPTVATTTAPEPATWALLGTGLAAVAGTARRRRVT